MNGYEIQTPFVWGISEHRDSFNLWKKAGYVRSYLFNPASELIGFYIVPPRKNPVDYQNAIHSLKVAHESIRKIEEHSVAGTKMMCIQSSLPESPLILDVVCVPDGSMGGISVSYTGNAEHVPEFFAILDGVKKTN